MFVCALALVLALWAAINIAVDPFGVFRTEKFGWDSYSMTLNPRIGKANYISERFDEFDSYVLGSSSAASYLPEKLDALYGAHFYNMFHYGADIDYDARLAKWLIENDDVKNVVLVLGLNEANNLPSTGSKLTTESIPAVTHGSGALYYLKFAFASPDYALEKLRSVKQDTEMPQTFDVFLPESGTYDKRLRDAEPIAGLDGYLEKNGGDFTPLSYAGELAQVDLCVQKTEEIARLCADNGVNFTLILSPVSEAQLSAYADGALDGYFEKLEALGAHNYAVTDISYDPRFFYDSTHTRNDTASMVLDDIFGARVFSAQTAALPVLCYHHFDDGAEESATSLHTDTFRRQMKLIADNGFTPVSPDEVRDFVYRGVPLPEKPVMITFDDGYLSNYEKAFPVLKEFGFKATVFAIGCSVGHYEYYKDTQNPITPHFGRAEAAEMISSGLISVQSHTYDMHMWPPYETGTVRRDMAQPDGESDDEYVAAVAADAERQRELFEALSLDPPFALAFPGGKQTALADAVLVQNGYDLTFTTDAGRVNVLISGLSQSMLDLGRMNINEQTTDEQILDYLFVKSSS